MARRPLAAIVTLGCKLNLADSEEIGRGLRAVGYETVDALCEADAIVVNSCSVTHVADQKSRKLVRSARRLSPGAAIALTGCYPATAQADALAALGADFVVGNQRRDRERLIDFLRRPGGARPTADTLGTGLHTRAFIAAQAGCNDVCAFCIVPRTRGRERSKPAGEIADEVNAAAEAGAREVVVTGTQLGAWGRDFEAPLLPQDLIATLLERTDVPRIRFSSLQPQDITPGLLGLWQDPRLMPHFHLALQSGSEAVLRGMRRRYSAAEYRQALEMIRAAVPDVAITTDVIAGFPGETSEDFAETTALCREAGFARIHAFPYSPRSRTAAVRLPQQVPSEARKERMAELLTLAAELSVAFRQAQAGGVRPVLWEEQRDVDGERLWHGLTDNYIPVYLAGEGLASRITPVRLGGSFRDGVRAEALEAVLA